MDVQLKELIDKIKIEGVEQAKQKSEQLVGEAKRKADEIVAEAKKNADRIIAEARENAEKAINSGNEALAQAARDLLLGLKSRIQSLFERVLETGVSGALSTDILERAILKAFDSLGSSLGEGAEVLLSESDAAALEKGLRARLKERLASGVVISPSPKLPAGFRISVEKGAAYYNFTPREIAEVLAAFLNPRLAALLTEAAAEE